MRYHVISNDDRRRETAVETLEGAGFEVLEEYDPESVVVTLGGDGTILYAARTFREPTLLPVRTAGSAGLRTELDDDCLVEAVRAIEAGAYTTTEHRKLAAYRDGQELQGSFGALNEVGLHHGSPLMAAVFAVRIRDGNRQVFERVVGDGALVATPFGSTGYYRSVTGGTFTDGIGLAFNNVHAPADVPDQVGLSAAAAVEFEVVESSHASDAVLTRDNAPETVDLAVGEPVTVRYSDRRVSVVSVDGRGECGRER